MILSWPPPRRRHLLAALTPTLVALLLLPACQREAADRRPNVLLISVDTLRPDHLGCYGYEKPTSPFIDSLAARGQRFEKAFAQASWTLPSHMTMLTSTYPHTHLVETPKRSLPESVPTLAGILQAAGYHTVGFVSWVYLSGRFGFARGFDDYRELVPPAAKIDPSTHHSIKAEAFVDSVLGWTEGAHDRPFFLFLHLFDVHMDYEPPLSYGRRFDPNLTGLTDGRFEHLRRFIKGGQHYAFERIDPEDRERAMALYDGEISYTDDQLQRLFDGLDARGLLENTLVVFTSDHGEEFDEHGSMEGHQWTLYEEVLRVPLILVLPGDERPGRAFDPIVQSLDIAPTILDLIGLPAPPSFEGRSLRPLIEGTAVDLADPVEHTLSQIRRFNLKWALRTPQYKLIYTHDTGTDLAGVPVTPGYELYDLRNDPGETENLYDRSLPQTGKLVADLQRWMLHRTPVSAVDQPKLSDEEIERLRSLGYIGN